MEFLKGKGRYLVAAIALMIAFALSFQFGERVQFDLGSASVSAQESQDEEYRLSSLRIFNRALLQIKENYVEPDRIEPGDMLLSALDAVQQEIPEFVVNYELEDDESIPSQLQVQVVDQSRTFELTTMESLWEMSLRLKEMFMFVEQHLPEDPERDPAEIEYAAINGMVSTLDPHSGLLTPTHYEEMQTQTGGEFGGLGIVISIQDDQLTVISPIDGTPASEEGIQSQDRITRIGDESTVNMKLSEAVNLLRGEPGTEIDIWIDREGWSDPRQFTLERAIIEIESVESEPLDDKIGYLRINNFQANTYSDMRSQIEQLRETMGGIEGLILDMRDNPGGLLDQSIRLSDIFLDEGTIVSTVGIGDTLRETREASASNSETDFPMAVLINEGSASASEIVAGALQQNDRAMVMGDTSFGKGTVQIMYEFPDDSALKLTVAQYLTPDGVSIQNTGITPDLRVIPVMVEPDSVRLFRSELMRRERDMTTALENPSTVPDDNGPLSHIRYLNSDAFDNERTVDEPGEFERDFEIDLASRLLRESGGQTSRTAMLEHLQDPLEEVFEQQMGEIQEQLSELDIDWTAGDSPDQPAYQFEVTSSGDEESVAAGDTVELTAALTNRNNEPLFRAKALSESENPQLRHREFIFGRVDPGETKEWTVEVDIPRDSRSRHDRIEFTVGDDNQEFDGQHHHDLMIEGAERPRYAFTYEVTGEAGEEPGDGLLRNGDDVVLRVHLENLGEAAGEETSLYLKDLTGDAIYLEDGRGLVEGLEPGQTESVDFQFDVREIPDEGFVEFEIDIYDTGFREYVRREFRLPVVETAAGVRSFQGLATVGDEEAVLRVGAHPDSDPLADAAAGATLPVVARSESWLKVQLEDRAGWISTDDVTTVDEGADGELAGIETIRRFQKPLVELQPAAMMTDQNSIGVQGTISDLWPLNDYYIIVQHREGPLEIETRKLDYQRITDPQIDLSTDVPLFLGLNEISVVARNDVGIETTETVFVFRE